MNIAVTNLSLYPVRIDKLRFWIDGTVALEVNRDQRKEWTPEIAVHSSMVVYTNESEWKKLADGGLRGRITDWRFVVEVLTDSGGRFSSNRLWVRVAGSLNTLRRGGRKMTGRFTGNKSRFDGVSKS